MSNNPFDSLYVTETIDPDSFVKVFSPLLVHDTSALFRQGNVVLVGTQGSGKSMLLTLMKPETRIAFANARQPFPLDRTAPPFIGAGVNLTRSGAIDFGQRSISHSDSPGLLEAYFADFLNYWIVRDLMRSVCLLATDQQPGIPLEADTERLDRFSKDLAANDVWSGALRHVTGFDELRKALSRRVRSYRDFLNFNVVSLPDWIGESKTSAGEPISVSAEMLREHHVIDPSTEIFVRIDQYEELGRLAELQDGDAGKYESVVHKMLGLRDPRVSYRVGTRRHAWPDRPRMQGTAAVLEEMRNYKTVDLDELLQRKEHAPGLFGRFADDVFRRRLMWADYECPPSRQSRCTSAVFGESLAPQEEAALYVKDGARSEVELPEVSGEVRSLLIELWHRDPLSARLGEAWIAQKGEAGVLAKPAPFPWEAGEWWKKERIPQTLLQIAARNRQRLIFCGEKDVVALAGSNILAFVSLCQSIWDAWLRNQKDDEVADGLPVIPKPYIQDEGVHQASAYWYRKIRSDRDGDGRQRFIALLGRMFRDWLRSDIRMSNPGHNGFSIELDDLASDPEVRRVLQEASSFGVLVDRLHTNRNRGGGRRVKWYLNPIYCPYFQIPVAHVKEPRYVKVAEVREWLVDSKVLSVSLVSKAASNQPALFD